MAIADRKTLRTRSTLPGADVLARHRADREAERHHRQEQRLDEPQPDPEPRLRRGAERPAHVVDDEQVDRDQRELGARGKTDLEHAPPRSAAAAASRPIESGGTRSGDTK